MGITALIHWYLQCSLTPVGQAEGDLLHGRYRGLELYTATYLGALLNTAYDDYLYCVPLNEYVVSFFSGAADLANCI